MADERALDYQSDIVVRQDGWLEVTETVKVRAEGISIRRGIYRDYPTRYEDRFGNKVEVLYEPRSVVRDGRPEDFHSEKHRNGVRTYFGSADRLLPPGEYTYVYRYDAGRMLGYFDSHDELYWNVTGLGWELPIDRASVNVSFGFELPADVVRVNAWTGGFGATESRYAASTGGESAAHVETTAPLNPGEGLTIAVSWPKGYVAEPGRSQKLGWMLSDNANLLVALAGLLAVLGYYIPVWSRHGRDPEAGVVVTRYEPPAGFSPASLRFIDRMAYDSKAMTAAIVNLAVKGYVRIEQSGDDHVLHKTAPYAAPALAAGEDALLAALFEKGESVELDNSNHEILAKARSQHKASLKRDYDNRYFRINGAMNLPAVLIAIAAAIIAIVAGGLSAFVIAVVIATGLVIVLFAFLMKRPTGIGRKVLDEAAGFKDYLEIAEKDEMNLRNPPEKTLELFERYLPFALAMGVEQRWAERFAGVFERLREPGEAPYHPSWYSGTWNVNHFGRTTAALASGLNTAISSSVTPPGSSSGSSGGFSGGGGGGGGGGGW